MSMSLLKGAFQTPALHKGEDDGQRASVLISAQQCFGLVFARWVADQHPADGQRRQFSAMPPRSHTTPLDRLFTLTIPLDFLFFPPRRWVDENLIEGGLACADDAWLASFGTLFNGKKGIVERIIKLSWGDQAHLTMSTVKPQCQASVRTIAQHTDVTTWKPAMHGTDHLPCPHRNGFVPLAFCLSKGRGCGKNGQEGQ